MGRNLRLINKNTNMKNKNILTTVKFATGELIFNKWMLMGILYSISALTIGLEGAKTIRAVEYAQTDIKIARKAVLSQIKPTQKGVITEVTAYNSLESQTDSTPCEGAYGNVCEAYAKGECVVASNFYPKNTRLKIQNVGECVVMDRMNARYTNRVDVFMGKDLERAKNFGVQRLEIIKL